MKADITTEAAVMAERGRFADGYARRDMAMLRAAFAPYRDAVLDGTRADEKRVGIAEIQAQAERDWPQTEVASMTFGWTSISAAGSVAWVATDAVLAATAGGQKNCPARANHLRVSDEWLILQAHFSFLTPDQTEGESFPTA